jgi:hypothetical protein
MKKRQGTTRNSLLAVQQFLDAHAAKFPAVAQSGARKKLDDAIAKVAEHLTNEEDHTFSSRSNTKRARALRSTVLRQYMAPIARIAEAELPHTQELEPLRLPSGKPSMEKVAAKAGGMAQVAKRYADVFIAAGLQADFVAELETATASMLQSVVDRKGSRSLAQGARAGLRDALRTARQSVHIIDAFVRTALVDDPTLLTAWKSVKKLNLPSVRSSSGTVASSTLVTSPAVDAA